MRSSLTEREEDPAFLDLNWGVDLQSQHERLLTEKYAKRPVVVMN
jgi:aspartyl/asparaginyl-tRNA synthetase